MPSDVNDHFVLLQGLVTARLAAVDTAIPAPTPLHGSVPYLSEQKGDIATQIQAALNNVGGIAALILTPTAVLADPTGITLDMYAPVIIQVQENVVVNRGATGTGIPALRLVSFIMRRLQGWPHMLYAGDPEQQRLALDQKPFVMIRDEPPLTYNVVAIAPIDLNAPLAA